MILVTIKYNIPRSKLIISIVVYFDQAIVDLQATMRGVSNVEK